jgi:hypothetical protein
MPLPVPRGVDTSTFEVALQDGFEGRRARLASEDDDFGRARVSLAVDAHGQVHRISGIELRTVCLERDRRRLHPVHRDRRRVRPELYTVKKHRELTRAPPGSPYRIAVRIGTGYSADQGVFTLPRALRIILGLLPVHRRET